MSTELININEEIVLKRYSKGRGKVGYKFYNSYNDIDVSREDLKEFIIACHDVVATKGIDNFLDEGLAMPKTIYENERGQVSLTAYYNSANCQRLIQINTADSYGNIDIEELIELRDAINKYLKP